MQHPRLTIVTPSYNQAAYLQQTIDSVLSQNYPNLEYIIIDGGSTDSSRAIIQRHAKHLAYWVSEKDNGQAHALNKGFAKATGDLHAYINSDDYYEPGALRLAADHLANKKSAWLCGAMRYFDNQGISTIQSDLEPTNASREDAFEWFHRYWVKQSSCFWTADLFAAHGPFNDSLRFVFDWEFFTRIRFLGNSAPICLPNLLSHFRLHPKSKTVSEGFLFDKEIDAIWDSVLGSLPPHEQRLARERRRWGKADKLQLAALEQAGTGQRTRALLNVLKSVTVRPSLLFQRRTLGCVRRAVALF